VAKTPQRDLLTDVAAKTQYNYSAQGQLAEAAQSISRSLVELKKIEQAAKPAVDVTQPPDPGSYGMAGLATVDWSGPLESLVHKIAAATGYKVKIMGRAPEVPLIITVYAKNRQLGDILRDVGYQAGDKAHVVIFPANQTIEVRYQSELVG
jgi:defect-in-organelle-trafficking protein DotD